MSLTNNFLISLPTVSKLKMFHYSCPIKLKPFNTNVQQNENVKMLFNNTLIDLNTGQSLPSMDERVAKIPLTHFFQINPQQECQLLVQTYGIRDYS